MESSISGHFPRRYAKGVQMGIAPCLTGTGLPHAGRPVPVEHSYWLLPLRQAAFSAKSLFFVNLRPIKQRMEIFSACPVAPAYQAGGKSFKKQLKPNYT
ncbi:MAG: hypothetical protein J5I98_32115 [Phaeodactylibacter sp.]|nr:hypothetical protein [Phaeodactylibacter sp.]